MSVSHDRLAKQILSALASLALVCSFIAAPAALQAQAPLYLYVPEFDAIVASYGRLGADVDNLPEGMVVTKVVPDSPADRVNLRPGDRITTIDGQAIHNDADALRVLNTKGVTETVMLLVDRGGETLTLSVPLSPDYEIETHRIVRHSALATMPAVTRLTLDVPPAARVYLNGKLMRTTGFWRQFEATSLNSNQSYNAYPVRVELDREGDTLSQDHAINLLAGESRELVINFDAPITRVARR